MMQAKNIRNQVPCDGDFNLLFSLTATFLKILNSFLEHYKYELTGYGRKNGMYKGENIIMADFRKIAFSTNNNFDQVNEKTIKNNCCGSFEILLTNKK